MVGTALDAMSPGMQVSLIAATRSQSCWRLPERVRGRAETPARAKWIRAQQPGIPRVARKQEARAMAVYS